MLDFLFLIFDFRFRNDLSIENRQSKIGNSSFERIVRVMKKWFILAGIVALIIIGGYFVLSFYAVKFIQFQLQKVVGPGFTVSEIKVESTFLSAKGIRYEDPDSKQKFFQIEEMRIYPNIFTLLKGTLGIRELTILQPSLYFYRSREGAVSGPWGPWEEMEKGREKKGISTEGERKGKEPPRIKIDRIRIVRGSIDFEDRKVGEPPAQIKLRQLDLDLKDVQYPIISARSPIELKAKMEGKTREGDLYVKGWIDLETTEMETSLKVREIDVKIFEPYYRRRVSAEIETGHIDMDATVAVRKRMIDAPGQLELGDLHMKEGGTVFWIPAKYLVSILKNKENRIKVHFLLKGNIDDPQFSLQEAFLNRLAISLAEALGLPIKRVGETILKGTGEGAKELSEGFKSIGDLLRKKKEKKR